MQTKFTQKLFKTYPGWKKHDPEFNMKFISLKQKKCFAFLE